MPFSSNCRISVKTELKINNIEKRASKPNPFSIISLLTVCLENISGKLCSERVHFWTVSTMAVVSSAHLQFVKGCGLIFWVTLQEKRKEVLELSKKCPEVDSFHCDYLVLRVAIPKVILKQSSVFPCWGMCLGWRDLWETQSNEKTLILGRVWQRDYQAVFTCYIAERSHDICSTRWHNLQSWFNLPWRLG